jgi:hypothetical protein
MFTNVLQVHVFDPMDYPDKNSGSLNEFLVGFATEYFLQIETKGIRSVEDVINYPLDKVSLYMFVRISFNALSDFSAGATSATREKQYLEITPKAIVYWSAESKA